MPINVKDKFVQVEDLSSIFGKDKNGDDIATTYVKGVKGDAESGFRTGTTVNLTPANIGAVSKSGDVMTGSLTVNQTLRIKDSTNYQYGLINFINSDYLDQNNVNQVYASIYGLREDHSLWFRTKNLNDDYLTEYRLPIPPATSTENKSHEILTTRSPVSVPQGGTGSTTPIGALVAFGVHPINITNIQSDSNGRATISFNSIGITSRPKICMLQSYYNPGYLVRYLYTESTSQIVLEFTNAATGNIIANGAFAIQGVVIDQCIT